MFAAAGWEAPNASNATDGAVRRLWALHLGSAGTPLYWVAGEERNVSFHNLDTW